MACYVGFSSRLRGGFGGKTAARRDRRPGGGGGVAKIAFGGRIFKLRHYHERDDKVL